MTTMQEVAESQGEGEENKIQHREVPTAQSLETHSQQRET